MKAHFDVLRPKSVDEAITLKGKRGAGARFWAGGTDMTLLWQRGQIDLDCCIDLTAIPCLDAIAVGNDAIAIGTLVTLGQLERAAGRHPLLRTLSDVTKLMCTPQTRSLATVGGNMCNASPAADLSPVFVALDASAILIGPDGERRIAMEAFFTGVKRTALAPTEMLARIEIPLPTGPIAASYRRVARTVVDIALVNAAAALAIDAKGRIAQAGIGLGAVAPVILRAPDAEALLVGKPIADIKRSTLEQAGALAADRAKPITDVRASADYRRHMITILVRRALEDCIVELRGSVA